MAIAYNQKVVLYTGDGVAGRQVDLGFTPDVVLIWKISGTSGPGVLKVRGVNAKRFNSVGLMATNTVGHGDTYFNVSDNVEVNELAAKYVAIAMGNGETQGNSGPFLGWGSYTGDGTDDRLIAVTSKAADMVFIARNTNSEAMHFTPQGDAVHMLFPTDPALPDNCIQDVVASGFEVGDQFNANTVVHVYFWLRRGDGNELDDLFIFDVFTHGSVSGGSLSTVGFLPAFVIAKQESGSSFGGAFRTKSPFHTGANSTSIGGSGTLTDGITSLDASGFSYGDRIGAVVESWYWAVKEEGSIDIPPPGPATIDPDTDSTTGGITATITGSDFIPGATVLFGETTSPNVEWIDDETLEVEVPPHSEGEVLITVENPDGQFVTVDNVFTYVLEPYPDPIDVSPRREPEITVSFALNDAPDSMKLVTNAPTPPARGARTGFVCPTTGTEVFDGVITVVESSHDDDAVHSPKQTVTVQDYSYLLNRKLPKKLYVNTSASAIIADLIDTYAPEFDTSNVEAGLPAITIEFTRALNVGGCISAVCKIVEGLHWYPQGFAIHAFRTPEVGDQPDDIDDDNEELLLDPAVKVVRDVSQLRNRIYVDGVTNQIDGTKNPIPDGFYFPPSQKFLPPTPGGDDEGAIDLNGSSISDPSTRTHRVWGYCFRQANGGHTRPTSLGGVAATWSINLKWYWTTGQIQNIRDWDERIKEVVFLGWDATWPPGEEGDTTIETWHEITSWELDDLPTLSDGGFVDSMDHEGLMSQSVMAKVNNSGDPYTTFEQIAGMREDLPSQATRAAIEGGDGVHEYYIKDESLTTVAMCNARADAELALFKDELVTVVYATTDPKTKVGRTVHVDLSEPEVVGDFLIQDVAVDQINISQGAVTRTPRYTATASSTRFTLEDFMRRVVLDKESTGGGSSSAGSSAPPSAGGGGGGGGFAALAGQLSPGADINGQHFDGTADIEIPIEDEDVRAATIVTVGDDSATMPNSRVLTAGDNITLDDSVPGVLTINGESGGGGGGYWSPLTDGDPDETELVFLNGDVIMVWIPD